MIWVGTSGYVYPHWRDGVFYPPGLRPKEELEFFARHFHTVELNNPFYRLPQKQTFIHWRERAPDDFLFAVKASRYITHVKKLKDPAEPLALFMERAIGLGDKLGPILFQFPATWGPDLERLRVFLKELPKRQEFAFEFRHSGWLTDSVYEALSRHHAALCLPVHPSMPVAKDVVTASFTYIRMHSGGGESGNFTPKELKDWAVRIQSFRKARKKVYVYFNNDQHGFAIRNAMHLRRLLGVER